MRFLRTLLLPLLLAALPALADTAPEPAPDQPLVERLQARQEALHADLETLNARWRTATDPRVRRDLAQAITVAKLDFEIDVLALQRVERPAVPTEADRAALAELDAALTALRAQRAKLVERDAPVVPSQDGEEDQR